MATLELKKLTLLQGAEFLRAYLECSDEIQAGIREMLEILSDPETDEDDREMTLMTLADALFPKPHDGKLGMDLEEAEQLATAHNEEARAVLKEMNREEKTFAERLQNAMAAKSITQEALAAKLGIGQPAISNMLSRQCRPQHRTIVRLAEALGVTPEDLWPTIPVSRK